MAKLETRFKKIIEKFFRAKLNKKFYFYPQEIKEDLKSGKIQNIQKYKIKLKCKRCGQISYRKIENLKEKTSCDNCKKRWSFNQFLSKAKELGQTEKFEYLFDKKWWNQNYKNRETRIKIKCKKCGRIFEQAVDRHLHGYGCKFCAGNQKMTYKEFLKKIKNYKHQILINEKWWNENYKNEQTKIPVKCEKHGIFILTVSQIKKHKNCEKCKEEKFYIKTRYNDYIRILKKVHSNKYDYSLITEKWWQENITNSNSKIPIICPKHGLFWQSLGNHRNGNGCPKCSGTNNEEIIRNYLISIKEKFIEQYPIKYKNKIYFYDFYLPRLNLLIEVDGQQHFHPVDFGGKGEEWARKRFRETKKSDFIKNKIAFIENYKLIRIPYWELKNYII